MSEVLWVHLLGIFVRTQARELSLGSAAPALELLFLNPTRFTVNLSPRGLKIQCIHTKYVKSLGFVLFPEVIATDGNEISTLN